MKLEKLYSDFVEHTSLIDGMYKTVFIQIADFLDMIKDIKWLSLSYTVEDETFVTDFRKQKEIPSYIPEMIQNLFERSYSFPDGSAVDLELEYKGKKHTITCVDNKLEVPSEIGFIHYYSMFKFFKIDVGVYDFFKEFDELFKFTDTFKTKLTDIYAPLVKKFKNQESREQADSGILTDNAIVNEKVYIEKLKAAKDSCLQRLKQISTMKEDFMIKKNRSLQNGKLTEGYDVEIGNLRSEYNTLVNTYNTYKDKFDKVIDIISEIEIELSGWTNLPNKNEIEIEYLKSKKEMFVKEKKDLEKNLNDTYSLIESTTIALKKAELKIREIDSLGDADIIVLEDTLNELNTQYEEANTELLTIDNELKQRMAKVSNDSARLQTIDNVKDTSQQLVEKEIIQHLVQPLQPSSVTVVLNYLRYYFVYHATILCSYLVKQYEGIDISILQALACKLVLINNFDVYYNNIFSIIDFADNRVQSVNILKA